jgi:hypothetical protein
MEKKHTPGPWKHAGGTGGWDCVKPKSGGLAICNLVENNPANATLIAAAPDLLEACKTANNSLNNYFCIDDTYEAATLEHKQIRAAIAKATGK